MPTTGTRTLPDTSFAAIAFELRVLLRREAAAIENFEYFIAGLAHPSPGLEYTLADLRQSVAVIADAYEVFSILATREREVRALDALKTPSPAPTPAPVIAPAIEEKWKCRSKNWRSLFRLAARACRRAWR